MKNHLSLLSPLRRMRARVSLSLAASVAVLLGGAFSAHAETWVPTVGGSWATPGNWDTTTVPNVIGALANFTPNNLANRPVTIDSGTAGFTVGSIAFDLTGTGTFTNSLTTGTAGSKLLLNNAGAGVTISTTGNGTGNNTISVPLVLNDFLTAQVDQVTPTSQAGSLNLTATMSGTGGVLKQGEGLMTFGTGAKSYTGDTILNGGRTRISVAAHPTATSKFTINAGAQLDLITTGTYTFGSGPLNLNGSGATSGPYAAFPGAIRNDTGLVATIASPIVLQSDTIIHIQATANTGGNPNPTGSLTLSNTVQGPGALILTAPGSNPDQGTLFLTNTNRRPIIFTAFNLSFYIKR